MNIEFAFIVFPLIFMALGFPIYLVLLSASAIIVVLFQDIPIEAIHQAMYGSVDKSALIAIPFFIFAGEIMVRGGLSIRIINWALALTRGGRGSLGIATVGASTLFGAISGSSPATVASIGKIVHEPLCRSGYGQRFSSGLITSAGAISIVIPPSIGMILYGIMAEQSIPDLFMAGILPGLLMAAMMAIYITFYARKAKTKDSAHMESSGLWKVTKEGIWAIGMPVIILGGIYLGLFSPTESAGVACCYAVFVTTCIYRELTFAEVWESAINAGYFTAQVLIIVACAGVFSWLLTINGIPQALVNWFSGWGLSAWGMLLVINIFLLLVGCVLDTASAILVLTPLLVPIVQAFGMDLVHFGIVMTVNLAIGMFTPPFGLNIFVSQAVLKVPVSIIYRGLVPFIGVNILALIAITYIPSISLFLVWFAG